MEGKILLTISFYIISWLILLFLVGYHSHRKVNYDVKRELLKQGGDLPEIQFSIDTFQRLRPLLPSKRKKAIFHLIHELTFHFEKLCLQWNYPVFKSIEECSNSRYPDPCDILELLETFEDIKETFDERNIINGLQKVYDAKFKAKNAHIGVAIAIDNLINPSNKTFSWDVPFKVSDDIFVDKISNLTETFIEEIPSVSKVFQECSEASLEILNQNKSSEASIEILKVRLFLENAEMIKTDISRRISVLNILLCLNNNWLNFFNVVSDIFPIVIVCNILLGILFHHNPVLAFSLVLIFEGVCYKVLAVTMDCYCKTQTLFWSFKVVKKLRGKSPSQRIYRLMNKKDRRRYIKRSKQSKSRKLKVCNIISNELKS